MDVDPKVVNTVMSCFYMAGGKAPTFGKTASYLGGSRKSCGTLHGGCYASFRTSRVDNCKANLF